MRGHLARVRCGWRGFGKEAAEVIALDDLRQLACLDVPDFDEGGREGEYIRIVQCYGRGV